MDPEIMHFLPLIVFGNIENLILAAQGVAARWAMKYARYINFVGGLAIFILGIQAMAGAIPGMLAFLP